MAGKDYYCEVHAYPCETLLDGSKGYCSEWSCVITGPIMVENIAPQDDSDARKQPFGRQVAGESGIRIPLDALVSALEQMGATVSFNEDARRDAQERYLVKPADAPTKPVE